MSAINPGIYRSVLKIRAAYPFDIAGFLMRLYAYMTNIGTVTMLTLSGYSFVTAGLVSSVLALTIFVVGPRISKLVDERGQHKVVPIAGSVAMLGLATMLVTVQLSGPEPVLFFAAILMGLLPNAQALTRARWTYLLRTGRAGDDAPSIRTVFSYEGIIDDIGFMVGPAAAITLSASLFPIAGMLVGGISYTAGFVLMTASRSTEPEVGWEDKAATGDDADDEESSVVRERGDDDFGVTAAAGEDAIRVGDATTEAAKPKRRKVVIREYPVVTVLFALMFLVGAFFGTFDTASVAFAEHLGDPNIASVAFAASSLCSIVVGFVFGMLRMNIAMYKQVVLFACLIGIGYGFCLLINSVVVFMVVSLVGALFYAPCLITFNTACERAVPGSRLTESITWLSAGCTCGIALGPTISGIVVDAAGSIASLQLSGIIALLIPVVALLSMRILKRSDESKHYEVSVVNR